MHYIQPAPPAFHHSASGPLSRFCHVALECRPSRLIEPDPKWTQACRVISAARHTRCQHGDGPCGIWMRDAGPGQ